MWAAMLVANTEALPEPGTLKGLTFFGATSEEAEQEALAYLGLSLLFYGSGLLGASEADGG